MRKSILNDTHALIKIRRKVMHAVTAADEANRKAFEHGAQLPVRQYSLCYPASTGATTEHDPHVSGPTNAGEARLAAEGVVDLFMPYEKARRLTVIDRVPFCAKITQQEVCHA